jgi:heme-binding NEAT domain protein
MKLNRLKKIIREEIVVALAENAPAKEKETTTTPPTTKPGTTPKRRGFDKPEPGVQPKPKASLKEEEKELVNKITQRFLKIKK